MKINLYIIPLCLCIFIAGAAAVPKPGATIKLTLINKMVSQPGYISLNGLINFHTYFFTARAYDIDVHGDGEQMHLLDDGHNKFMVTTYEVRKDLYEGSITSCGSINAGVFDLDRNTTVIFPPCERSMYGTQYVVEPKSKCIINPTLAECKKQGFILTVNGGTGELNKIKVRKPPMIDDITGTGIYR